MVYLQTENYCLQQVMIAEGNCNRGSRSWKSQKVYVKGFWRDVIEKWRENNTRFE
jgi:hypothetical protein